MGNVSIIIAECMAFRDGVLAAKNNGFLNLEIKGDSKVVIDSCNKKSNISSSIMLLTEDIWKITQDFNVCICCYIYREANRTTDYLAKKCIYNLESCHLEVRFS